MIEREIKVDPIISEFSEIPDGSHDEEPDEQIEQKESKIEIE